MGRLSKLFKKILDGHSDQNIKFSVLCNLLNKLGFKVRISGSHHIFYKEDICEIINIQEKNGYSKAYQIKQIREIFINHKLDLRDDEKL
jgi:predicted RNA binding protein YcfA (HicA-like mRNA interferase family)